MSKPSRTTDTSDDPSVSDNPVPTPPEDVMKRAPSDEGLLGVVDRLPGELWENLALSLGVPFRKVKECSQRGDRGGVEALAYWRNGRSGSDHPISWEHLLEKVSSGGEGEMAVDDLKREVLKWPSWSISQGCPPQSRTVVTSTTAEPTPSLSSSDDERTRKLEKGYKRLKQFYSRDDVTGVKSRYMKNVQFINLATVQRDYPQAKPRKDVTEFLEAVIHGIDGYCWSSRMIKYEDILTCNGKASGKRVVITGSPGCGKTTLARKLCKDLYSKVLANRYHLILFYELRRLKLHLDPENGDIDLPFLLHHMDLPSELCPVIEEQAGEGVALILDGFDEIADELKSSRCVSKLFSTQNPYLSECDVFLTTRPSRYRDLMSMIEASPFHIEILGFTSADIDSYIETVFKKDEAKSHEVIHRLETLPLVRGMCRIPRVLEIVCMVQEYLNDDPLPENLSGIFLKYICHQLEEYLSQTHPSVKKRIENLLEVPEDLFPGFYQLCEVAYKCCLNQCLILTDEDLGDLKKYVDDRGSIYNLLFSEDVDDRCPIVGVLYQCDHKTVQEALGAVHIGLQSEGEQEKIWREWFNTPHMAEVWKMYCGLTGLEHVDLASLSFSSLSERAREVMDQYHLHDDDMLVMMSLYEANNRSVSGQVLQAVFKNTIHAFIKFPYDSQVVSYATSHHPNLQKVDLTFSADSDLSASDLKPVNMSIRNLKAIELDCPPVETVLSALSGQVEELRLIMWSVNCPSESYWKNVGDALEANHCLRSLHINLFGSSHEFSVIIEGLCRNERLTELSIDTDDLTAAGIPVESLKRLLVHREKCRTEMQLTRQEWCVVLSGLKDAKKLKELCVYVREVKDCPIGGAVRDQSDECLISSTELEEMIATHDHLVKVDVGCDVERLEYVEDLVLAMLRGAFRNRNILELGIAIWSGVVSSEEYLPSIRSVLLPFVETSAHTDHITCVRFEYSLLPVAEVLGDEWCDLLVTGPMSRPVCHFSLDLAPAECGLLLSRVHNVEQLEELSLTIWPRGDESPVDVQAVEGALSNCRLRKLRINADDVSLTSTQWTTLFCAVLRGIAANHNDVEFVLQGQGLDGGHLMSQLPHHCAERFELVKRRSRTLFILKPRTPTGSIQRSLTSEESTSEVEASSDQVSTEPKRMSPPLSPSREDQPHPISHPSSPVLTSAPNSPEHTESISSSSLSTGRDPTSQPLQGNKKSGSLCSQQPRCQPIQFIMLLFSLVLIPLMAYYLYHHL